MGVPGVSLFVFDDSEVLSFFIVKVPSGAWENCEALPLVTLVVVIGRG